ncbi:hypothetical protein O181_067094 [Austropuccinia psidii MF-1]|uniref:Exoribonuclease phosphorolytic domain-containing protein n=1 Tax=Austropuccinia psidii MF-1 TaxID=1389203 RepID=A0A9Q3I664_9BASI|nr:hypothetical protein [Austropuccinia psidii MF-1]
MSAFSILSSTHQASNVFDRRRFVGPESSTPFEFPQDSDGEALDSASNTLQTRADGRSKTDNRPICIKVGTIFQANGSCYIESGKNKVICAVYGPKARSTLSSSSSSSPLVISLRFAPFCVPGGHLSSAASANAEAIACQLLHQSLVPSLLPMAESAFVEIHVTVLEWDGPLSAGLCTMACSIALASASIPIVGLVIPTTLALLPEPCIDPTASEALAASAIFDMSSIPAMQTVTHTSFRTNSDWNTGSIDLDLFDQCLDQCLKNAELLHGFAAKALQEHFQTCLTQNSGPSP